MTGPPNRLTLKKVREDPDWRPDLTRADLTRASLTCADLDGGNLTGADLADVYYDGATGWPEGFTPKPGCAMRRVPRLCR